MKKEKGITLIALIITIVVLLILAVVSINSIEGEDSILAYANNAASMYNQSVKNEQLMLNEYLNYLNEELACKHTYTNGVCSKCGGACTHDWNLAAPNTNLTSECEICGLTCNHSSGTEGFIYSIGNDRHVMGSKCALCKTVITDTDLYHSYNSTTGVCSGCSHVCTHTWSNGTCTYCEMSYSNSGLTCTHTWSSGVCTVCGTTMAAEGLACTTHTWNLDGSINYDPSACTTCGLTCTHPNTTDGSGGGYIWTKCDDCGKTLMEAN